MKTITLITTVIISSVIFAACTKPTPTSPATTTQSTPAPTPETKVYTPSDPVELFLIELSSNTKLPFKNPVKSDIIWNEGETSSNLSVYYGDAFLIEHLNSKPEDEIVVADYFSTNGFVKIPFNESVGEDSHKVGYRKDNLVCKYDQSQYSNEAAPHLNIVCTDATKASLRK